MKLGTQTGSLINHIFSRATDGQPTPVVGMGATILSWTDRDAATIIAVWARAGGTLMVEVQEDTARRTDKNGLSECQEYEYTPNPNGPKSTFEFRGGRWQSIYFNEITKRWKKSEGCGLRIGEREKYHDFSF